MGQVNSKLRRATDCYIHWCPACEEPHQLPDTWKFDGNLDLPTFSPSFKHEGFQIEKINGKWTGGWVLDKDGKPLPWLCHYNLIAGKLHYHADSTHTTRGIVDLPVLPDWLQD